MNASANPLPSTLVTPRDGLPNAGAKLKRAEELTVVFIGGSITRGGGEDGYVASVEAWLKQSWPQATIHVVNAGVGGTDSAFGAKRFDRDVLVHNPDLVLVEFAVNDGDNDHRVHMERIVHKTWLRNPRTDLAFFYTLSKGHLEDYRNGNLPRAAAFHEQVAIHYGIPTIGLAHAVAAKLEAGDIEWSQFANDAVHPHAEGYHFFNETFREVLPVLLNSGEAGPHVLSDPLTPDLQVYPPLIQVVPQDLAPFKDAEGRTARHAFAAPIPGQHWIDEPVFSTAEGKSLWRLHWMDKARSATMDKTIGQKKADWARNPQHWFAEGNAFTGPEGNPLYSGGPQGITLGFSGHEVAVLIFVAPETGRYIYRFGADQLNAWKNEDTDFALNVVFFPWGEESGHSHILYRAKRREAGPFSREGEVHLTAGEELAFIVGTDTPGHVRGGWQDFWLQIGYFETPPGTYRK